jgi:hypothetical protein
LQYFKWDVIGHRLTGQLISIVQVKVARVVAQIGVEVWKLGQIPIIVGRFETEHEADDKR